MTTDAPPPRSPMDRLRDELDRDARLLQALTPGSDAAREEQRNGIHR